MKQRYNRYYQYKFTRPPRALWKARLDNIAIVLASMLAFKEDLAEKVNKLPPAKCFSVIHRKIRSDVSQKLRLDATNSSGHSTDSKWPAPRLLPPPIRSTSLS